MSGELEKELTKPRKGEPKSPPPFYQICHSAGLNAASNKSGCHTVAAALFFQHVAAVGRDLRLWEVASFRRGVVRKFVFDFCEICFLITSPAEKKKRIAIGAY